MDLLLNNQSMVERNELFRIHSENTDSPIEMLLTCHEKVQNFLNLLIRVHAHLISHGVDSQTEEASQRIIRYFTSAAQHHHDDEEKDLFPALLGAMAGSDAVCIRALVTTLTSQHQRLNQLWSLIYPTLRAISEGHQELLDLELIKLFKNLYEQHLQIEEKELFPIAERILTEAQTQKLRLAMVNRRTVL